MFPISTDRHLTKKNRISDESHLVIMYGKYSSYEKTTITYKKKKIINKFKIKF